MIIKSHIRAGYRAAADYLKDQGLNEKIRLVQISDPDASNLDEAFQNMWAVAGHTKAKKPLHHISINPFKDERLTDEQVLKIIERCELKYGYKPGEHQRVIVEHIKDGRQHFHVMWCRVSLATGKAVWPGLHWNKSKEVCREMERELGLKQPLAKRVKRMTAIKARTPGLKTNRLVLSPIRNPKLPYWILPPRSVPKTKPEALDQPARPISPPAANNLSAMSEAQRIDFIAACDGKITWQVYFQKWGNQGPAC